MSKLSLSFMEAGADHSVAHIWVQPKPLACVITAISPVDPSGGMRQRSMESPIPAGLLPFMVVSSQNMVA